MIIRFSPTSSRALFSVGAAAAAVALLASQAQAHRRRSNPLVTGKSITRPPLGTQQNVGSLPMNMILTPDGKFAIPATWASASRCIL